MHKYEVILRFKSGGERSIGYAERLPVFLDIPHAGSIRQFWFGDQVKREDEPDLMFYDETGKGIFIPGYDYDAQLVRIIRR